MPVRTRNNRLLVSVSQERKNGQKYINTTALSSTARRTASRCPGQSKTSRPRSVRLHLEGENYLHLGEVEVFAEGPNQSIALGKPATQFSTSPWGTFHAAAIGNRGCRIRWS